MAEVTLESLVKRVEELERIIAQMNAPPVKDWRRAAGLADREAARQEFGE
jgi:hypothetical protein